MIDVPLDYLQEYFSGKIEDSDVVAPSDPMLRVSREAFRIQGLVIGDINKTRGAVPSALILGGGIEGEEGLSRENVLGQTSIGVGSWSAGNFNRVGNSVFSRAPSDSSPYSFVYPDVSVFRRSWKSAAYNQNLLTADTFVGDIVYQLENPASVYTKPEE